MAKKEKILGQCSRCKFARLMRSSKVNPVVAECDRTGERNVASTTHACSLFRELPVGQEKEITKMIFLT